MKPFGCKYIGSQSAAQILFCFTAKKTKGRLSNESKIGISVTNLKTNKTVDIKGIEKTRKGTMTGFRNNNLIEVVEFDQ